MLACVFAVVVLISVLVVVGVLCVVAVNGCAVTVLVCCLDVAVVGCCVVCVLEAVLVIEWCVVVVVSRVSVGFCSVPVVIVMKGSGVIYDVASLVYDDVFSAVNSEKNEKASLVTVMFLYVSNIVRVVSTELSTTSLTVALKNDWV